MKKILSKLLFAENAGLVFQADASIEEMLSENNIEFYNIGEVANTSGTVTIKNKEDNFSFDVSEMRDVWYKTSYLLDQQTNSKRIGKKQN